MLTSSSGTNYVPNEHEDVDQYDPYAIPSETRYVDGTLMSEVTPVTIRYINPPHLPLGHSHGHEWSTHIPFVPCQSALPFLK